MKTRGKDLYFRIAGILLLFAVVALFTLGLFGGPNIGAKAEPLAYFMLYQPWFTQDSTAYIANMGDNLANIAINYYPAGSNQVYIDPLIDEIPSGAMVKVSTETTDAIPNDVDRSAVMSDYPLKSVVALENPDVSGDELALYRGTTEGYGQAAFGPFYKDVEGINSKLIIINLDPNVQNIDFEFISDSGSTETTFSRLVGDRVSLTLEASELSDIPSGFTGSVRVGSGANFSGILVRSSQDSFQVQGPLWTQATALKSPEVLISPRYLPRLFNSTDEGSGARTSQIALLNTTDNLENITIDIYDPISVPQTFSESIPSQGMKLIDMGELGLDEGHVYSAVVEGSNMLGVGELTRNDASPGIPVGSYQTDLGTRVRLLPVVRSANEHSVFSIQNTGSQEASVDLMYLDLDGDVVHFSSVDISKGTAVRIDSADLTELGDNFEGQVWVDASQTVTGMLDLYRVGEGPAPNGKRILLPLLEKNWPPIPTTPKLSSINNSDQDSFYTVSWQKSLEASTYRLEESTEPTFSKPTVVYQGPNTQWTVSGSGKLPAIYYYRVRGVNSYGQSEWSSSETVTIYPLFVGLKIRWDGNGYVRGSEYYDIGYHETRQLDQLIDADTIRSDNFVWYDPNPVDIESSSWFTYYSVTTGEYKTSNIIDDPSWKWGLPWKLPYTSQYTSNQIITIGGQSFTVTGPHQGYTTYGKTISYWEFVNRDKFVMWDGGGDWKQYVHPGEAILRYDAGNSKLLIYDNVIRRWYYQGDLTSDTIQYIDNISSASSLPGSPPIELYYDLADLKNETGHGLTNPYSQAPFIN